MKICFIGTGYVGLVSGTCFAEIGHNVTCVDKMPDKIDSLKQGIIPIYEPGLEELVNNNSQKGTLTFTENLSNAVKNSDVIFIAVGTPQNETGEADLTFVKECAKEIAIASENEKLIITKSTVPVKTGRMIKEILSENNPNIEFRVASNPEFLREGSAVNDFMEPDRIIVGIEDGDKESKRQIEELYSPLTSLGYKILFSNLESAELIKYASNAFLATKIAFINEMADLSESCGANIGKISEGMGLDKRIAPYFLNPGPGYGGSCFPKDTNALNAIAKEFNTNLKIVDSTIKSNNNRIGLCFNKIEEILNSKIQGAKIAILGAAFKGNTDDVRESPAIKIVRKLCEAGAKISLYDPEAINNAKKDLSKFEKSIEFFEDQENFYNDADAVIILTEWNDFKNIELNKISNHLKRKLIIDFRNLLNPKDVKDAGFEYHCVGNNYT